MDTQRPITDYEVECNFDEYNFITKGVKYPIVKDGGHDWYITDNEGDMYPYPKAHFSAPTLRPECNILQSKQDYEVFADAIANPAPPNDALKQAQEKYMKAMCIVNPDIDLLDKFAMAALTGLSASIRGEYDPYSVISQHCYKQAQAMLQVRKKYLTINTPDNG